MIQAQPNKLPTTFDLCYGISRYSSCAALLKLLNFFQSMLMQLNH